MLLDKLYKRQRRQEKGSDCFVLNVIFNSKVNAQVVFKTEDGNFKIVRFNDKFWSRELRKADYLPDIIELKIFVYTPNLKSDSRVKLSILDGSSVLKEESFILPKENEFSGWFHISTLIPGKMDN